ncbi:hypothetical protein HDU79_007518 [Rhizoclosmatium sp. JEL0117]|nr:hypothetical protein HDU79_007518 [Rhizoclosmatium sp. JEL0117]
MLAAVKALQAGVSNTSQQSRRKSLSFGRDSISAGPDLGSILRNTSMSSSIGAMGFDDIDRTHSLLLSDDQLRASMPKRVDPRQMIEFGGKKFNLAILKKRAFTQCTVKVTKNFRSILQSTEFDKFLLSAAHYVRWYVQVLHLEKQGYSLLPRTASSAGSQISSASREEDISSGGASARRQSVFRPIFVEDGGGSVEREVAVETRDEKLKELADAYCYLLLLVAKNTTEPARERAYFECIYAFTKDIVGQLININAYTIPLETELNRLFRGDLFCGTDCQDSLRNTPVTKRRVSIVAVTKDLWGGTGGGAAGSGSRGGSRPPSGKRPSSGKRPGSGTQVLGSKRPVETSGASKFKAKAMMLGKLSGLTKPPRPDIFGSEDGAAPGLPSASVFGKAAAGEVDKLLPPLQVKAPGSASTTKPIARKRMTLGEIRVARSPLVNAILPAPPKFMFT